VALLAILLFAAVEQEARLIGDATGTTISLEQYYETDAAEYTPPEDITRGADTLLHTILELDRRMP
jgi:hypothetical protein